MSHNSIHPSTRDSYTEANGVTSTPESPEPPPLAAQTGRIPPNLYPSLHATFVPLPSDPTITLSTEQLNGLFPGDQIRVGRDILAMLRARGKAADDVA